MRLAVGQDVVFGSAEPIVVNAEKSARPLGFYFSDESVVVNRVIIVGIVFGARALLDLCKAFVSKLGS